MTYLESIDYRTSRRTYLKTAIDQEVEQKLITLINQLNVHAGLSMEYIKNAKKIFGSLSKSYGLFKNVNTIIALKGKKNDPNLCEKCGYYGEQLVLEATKHGLGTCWVSLTYNKALVNVKEDEKLICVVTLGNVNRDKSIKEKLIAGRIHKGTKAISQFYNSNVEVPEWFISGITAVSKAPSARNTQKVQFEYKNNSARAFVPNDCYTDLIDLGIAKRHFVLASRGTFTIGNNGILQK